MLSLFMLKSVVLGHETGLILSDSDELHLDMDEFMVRSEHLHVRAGDDSVVIPAELNWAAKGKMNAVKSQGGCGSCWAFAAADALSSRYAIKNNEAVQDVSEKHILDCTFEKTGRDGCSGGWSDLAWKNVGLGGIAGQTNYKAYNAKDETCPTDAEFKSSGYKKAVYSGMDGADTTVHEYFTDLRELKEDMTIYGPCVMYMGADAAFMSYSSGVWRCGASQINHAITVVGWGQENGENYWMIKNSWGTGWGDNGYGKISMDHCKLGDRYGIVMKCPEARRKPTEVAKSACGSAAMSLGTAPDNAEECVELARTTPGCGQSVMFSEGYKKSWGCYCCRDTDTAPFGDHNIWNTYTRAKMTKLPGRSCANQAINLGGDHKTPESCMSEAIETPACGNIVMYPNTYASWGCRCCPASADHFHEHPLWDTYISDHCPRPAKGCDQPNDVYQNIDCDGDGKLDHVCTTTQNNNRWVILSSEGCGAWKRDDSNTCVNGRRLETMEELPPAPVQSPANPPADVGRRMDAEEMNPPLVTRLLKTFEN